MTGSGVDPNPLGDLWELACRHPHQLAAFALSPESPLTESERVAVGHLLQLVRPQAFEGESGAVRAASLVAGLAELEAYGETLSPDLATVRDAARQALTSDGVLTPNNEETL
jgi:hypothetical protein